MSLNTNELLAKYNKEYGKHTIIHGVPIVPIPRLPTGILPMDIAIGGGLPMGRASIIYGPESSCKTNVALKCVANAQKRFPDKRAVFFDIEGHFDASWSKRLGVKVDDLVLVVGDNAEQNITILEDMTYASDVSFIVMDSLAALGNSQEFNKSAEGETPGGNGRAIGKLYRRLSLSMAKSRMDGRLPTVLLINQIRYKIGGMYPEEVLPGGQAFKYCSSLTMRLRGVDRVVNSVNSSIAAFKDVTCAVKKRKIDILSSDFDFPLAVLDVPEMNVRAGESYDYPIAESILKSTGVLTKGSKAKDPWVLSGVGEFRVLSDLKAKALTDPGFYDLLKDLTTKAAQEHMSPLPPDDKLADTQPVPEEEITD